jgi:hypothetical protein
MKKPLDKKAFVIATLRKASYRWPTRNEAIKRARVKVEVGTFKNGNIKSKFMAFCEKCGLICDSKDTVKDHVIPVIDVKKGFIGWDSYVERMFPDTAKGYQILCKSCNKNKTLAENEDRKEIRQKNRKKLAKAKK